jgi:hypothetical protein
MNRIMRSSAVFVLLLMSLALGAPRTSVLAEGPELKLKAPRMIFMRPRMPNEPRRPTVAVRVTGQLENLDKIEDPEEYYCLEEIWDWDDETESEYAPDCEPYAEGAELKTNFSASHEYRYPGTYNVYLRLMRNGKTILAGNTRVEIRS